MKKEDKFKVVENIVQYLQKYPHFYVTDPTGLNAADTMELRRMMYNEKVKMVVVKNTLFKKALEKVDLKIDGINHILKSQSAILFTDTPNLPAKVLKKFRTKDREKPILKGAYVEESLYVGDNSLETLASLKSKKELIADVILQLQSPVQNLLSQLNSAPNTIGGIVKTLSEKE